MDTERRNQLRNACSNYSKAFKRRELILQGKTKHLTQESKDKELKELALVIKHNYDKTQRFVLQSDNNNVKYFNVNPTAVIKAIADMKAMQNKSELIDYEFYQDCLVLKEYMNAITT